MKYCPECKAELVVQLRDAVQRQACSNPLCHFVVWDNPVPVVAGLIMYQDKVLLARNSAWSKGVFSMITGYLDRNEAPEHAIVRETKEELGLDVYELRFLGHYPFVTKNQLIIAFCLLTEGEIKLNDEIAEIKLFDKHEVIEKDFGHLLVTEQIVRDFFC